MEVFAAMFGLSVAMIVVVSVGASLLYPVFWIWMLVDSIIRETWEYPGGTSNDKLVWVLLNALVQPVSILYFFLVYRKVARGSVAAPYAPAPNAPYTPSAA